MDGHVTMYRMFGNVNLTELVDRVGNYFQQPFAAEGAALLQGQNIVD